MLEKSLLKKHHLDKLENLMTKEILETMIEIIIIVEITIIVIIAVIGMKATIE